MVPSVFELADSNRIKRFQNVKDATSAFKDFDAAMMAQLKSNDFGLEPGKFYGWKE